jgi:hypothetical protein
MERIDPLGAHLSTFRRCARSIRRGKLRKSRFARFFSQVEAHSRRGNFDQQAAPRRPAVRMSPPLSSSAPEATRSGSSSPTTPPLPERPLPPGYVCVLCPTGFTASSMKEHANARPLYARLIYRPL